jgi:FAD/FMN-containing dehydrogenase
VAVIEPDTKGRICRVSAGARWRDVIRALNPMGFSPAVTQSNHDFSVGGTLSVNAHGWRCRSVRSAAQFGASASCSPMVRL